MYYATANRPFNSLKCAEQHPPEEPQCGPSPTANCRYDCERQAWICECDVVEVEYYIREKIAEHLIPACLMARIWRTVRRAHPLLAK